MSESMRPASRSGIAAPRPLYGTCAIFVPANTLNASAAAGAVVELSGLRLRERNEFLYRPRGHARMNDQDEARTVRHQRDGRKVLHRVVGQALIGARQAS